MRWLPMLLGEADESEGLGTAGRGTSTQHAPIRSSTPAVRTHGHPYSTRANRLALIARLLLRTDPGPQVGRATRTFMDLYFHKPSGWGGQALAELGFVVRRTTTHSPEQTIELGS